MGRISQLVSAGVLAVLAAACSTPPSRFYTLGSTAVADGAAAASYGVLVGPVTIPGAVDRPEMVTQLSPNRVELQEFDRWAAPLADSIARAVAQDLSILLGTPDVAVAPLANFKPGYRVTIDVQRFDSTPGDSVQLEAVWAVHPTAAKGETRSGRSNARETVQGTGLDAVAAAHSRALGAMSADIAAAIRAAAAAKVPDVEMKKGGHR